MTGIMFPTAIAPSDMENKLICAGVTTVNAPVIPALAASCAALERGLAGLNDVLEKLGEKQVVVEAPARRRGWFFGRNSRG